MSGWFAVMRGITAHPVFHGRPERLAVFMWLLDNAAWKDTQHDVNGTFVAVPRGSLCASTRHIAKEVGVGHQVVRTALKVFQKQHMVNTDPTQGKNVISVCNYGKYQDPKGKANTAPNTEPTQSQHKPNTQKKQGNKVTKEAKASSSQEVEDYDSYLMAHPKAVDSDAGAALFSELVADGVDPKQIIAAAKAYAATVKGWSSEAKVQQSDNFLDPERGKWKSHVPKQKAPAATQAEQVDYWAKKINGDGFVAANAINSTLASALVQSGAVTPQRMKERGIAA